MKKWVIVLCVLTLTTLALSVTLSISEAARSSSTDDEPDIPRAWKNVMSKEEYMLRRNEHIALLRGLGSGVSFDPALRMQAIRQLDEQQQRLLGGTGSTSTATSETQSGSTIAPITGPWTPIGPFPIPNGQTVGVSTAVSGRTVAIAVHPTNPDIAYVGTAQGGLYRTTNGGATWVPLMDNALSLAIGTLTLAPSNPEILFVGTGEQTFSASSFFGVGIYRVENASSASPTIVGPINRDAGNNDVFSGRAIGDIVVHPTDPNIIFVGTTSGIGGIGPSAPPVVPNRGLFRSTNAMSSSPTFNKLAVTSIGVGENRAVVDLVMEPGNPNRIIASVVGTAALATTPATPADNGGLFLTTNAMDQTPTFTRTLDITGNTSTATRTELAINKTGGNLTIYAASALGTGSVYKSTDGGQTWVMTVDNNFCNPQCFYDIAIDVDPTNANRVYLGGSPVLAFGISTNGGTSFTPSQQGLHVDSHVISVAPSNPQVIYFGSDGGIYRSNNAGATWTSLSNSTFSATQFMSVAIHPTDPNFTIGGTQDNGTEMLRFDGTWRRTDYGDGGYAAIDQSSSPTGATMYHTYFNANTAGGSVVGYAFSEDVNAFENWSFRGCQITGAGNGITCTDSVLFYAPLETGPGTPNTVYYGSDRLYRSDNKGVVHTVVSQAPLEVNTAVTPPAGIPISAIGISPANDNVRVVGLRNGGLWGTTTGSPAMTNLDPNNVVPNAFVARVAIDPNNQNVAYITLSAFGVTNVWKTTSLTTPNWTPANGSGENALPQVPVNAFVIDPAGSNRVFAGTDIGVYSSADGGASWTPVGVGLPRVAVFDMGINSERKLRIATHGRGMYEILLPGGQVSQNVTFSGLAQVTDSQECDRLTLTWDPATSTNPNADIAYDIYRVSSMPQGNGTQEPTFTPDASNRVATNVTGTTFTDTGLTRNQLYYYIVQARDRNTGRIDTMNTGNRVVKFSAPTSPKTASTLFANETFDSASANNRFTPPLSDSATADPTEPAFQRVPNLDFGGSTSAGVFAPNFDPPGGATAELGGGAPSDFSAIIGPFTLTADSVLEFDHRFITENTFDGGVMELAIGAPTFNATPYPDNVTTFDLGNHFIQNGYTARLDGTIEGAAMLSILQGRRAFTGSRAVSRTKISLRAFAGAPNNPQTLPVYIRFRMTSDMATTGGPGSGWYIDNVAMHNLAACGDATPTPTPTPTVTPTPTPTPTPSPTPTPETAPISFESNTMTDFSATSGEPIIKVDKKDRIFVTTPFGLSTTISMLWRSDDGGRSYLPLGPPVLRDAVTGPGGGDSDVDFDDKDRVYFIDLWAGCVTVAVSEDGGNTFPTDRTSYVSCVSGETQGAIDDRQWIAAYGDGRAYMTWRRFTGLSPLPFYMFRTRDAGRTWDEGRVLGNVTQSGPLKVDKTKRRVTVAGQERDAILAYQIYFNGNDIRMFRITDLDDGTDPIVEDFRIYNGGSEDTSNVFPIITVDKAGNLYAAWSQQQSTPGTTQTIFMATSTDRGQTWSQPKRVSTFTGSNIMPWIVAGDPGRAAIVWYRSPVAGNPNSVSSEWMIYMAQTLNAFDATPGFQTVPVSHNIVKRGEICTDGTLCDATGRDRSFLEYPSVDMDSRGAAVVVYNDNTNQSDGPYVMTAKQTTGPSLLASVGLLGRESGTVSITAPAANSTVRTETLTIEGTHTLPAKNFDRDETGDAHFRSTGANMPGADLRSVSLREEGDSLVMTMQVADLTAAARSAAAASVANGDGMFYVTQWDYLDRIYWLGAEVRSTGTSFYTGTLGMIRSATSKKFITYNPDLVKSQQVQGQMTAAAPGVITIRIPKNQVGSPPVGAQFHSVTGYALSERGPLVPVGTDLPNGSFPAPTTSSLTPDPTSLPVQLDASGAFTYTAGATAAITNGVVEVSLDDQSFNAPRVASFSSDLGEARWRLQLSGADLTAGAHTAYVRQRINGRDASPVVAVQFTVSSTVEQPVTSLVSFTTTNPRSSGGVSSYDLSIRNTSTQTIFAPMRLELANITSSNGSVTVANADNGLPGAGAIWDYTARVGSDGALTANELSLARNIRFNNPNNVAFTVTFNVVGNLPRTSGGTGASSSSLSGDSTTSSSGSTSSSTPSLTTGLLQLSYNPLLNTVTVQFLKP